MDFFFLLHIYTSRHNFFVFNKISYLQPFKEIVRGQRIRKFSAKMTPQAKKMTFFRIFFFSCTSTHQGANFLFLLKFHIFMGGQEKSVTSTNDERRRTTTNDERTNEQRRTTWTMIIARQDSFRILGLITLDLNYSPV